MYQESSWCKYYIHQRKIVAKTIVVICCVIYWYIYHISHGPNKCFQLEMYCERRLHKIHELYYWSLHAILKAKPVQTWNFVTKTKPTLWPKKKFKQNQRFKRKCSGYFDKFSLSLYSKTKVKSYSSNSFLNF